MTAESQSARAALGRARGKRAAHAVVLVIAILFIGSSTWQIVGSLFGRPSRVYRSPSRAALTPAARTCAAGIQQLADALDRAGPGVAASNPRGGEVPSAPFTRAMPPEWDHAAEVRQRCESFAGGEDAWAALERLRSAQEQLARHGQAELEELRRDLAAHLPTDLR
jgi:hypothetical protein